MFTSFLESSVIALVLFGFPFAVRAYDLGNTGMPIEQRRLTLDEFLALPEEEPALELHPDGTVTQKVSPKGRHSSLQGALIELINGFARRRRLALAFPELRTVFGGAAYVPDVAVYRWERIPRTAEGELLDDFTEPPDIVIEIISPGQTVTSLVRKCIWYVERGGVGLALLIDPLDRSVLLFHPNTMPRALRGADPIDLAEVLPEFEATVAGLFSTLKD
jgi:Uma2 family endonuclease